MIDLHCHILPGVDDGAADLHEAVAMAEVAARDGITAIVATPHGSEWVYTGSASETGGRVAALGRELASRGISLEVLAGMEVHVGPDLAASFDRGGIYTLNASRYMLVEFPLQMLPAYAEQALFELQLRNLVPVIAHPERNQAIAARPELLWQLVERGMLAQITASSLTGMFGSRTREVAELLVERRAAHVIASDAHAPSGRSPQLADAVKRAAELIGREAAEAMVSATPGAIIRDEALDVPPPEPLVTKRSWFPFGRSK